MRSLQISDLVEYQEKKREITKLISQVAKPVDKDSKNESSGPKRTRCQHLGNFRFTWMDLETTQAVQCCKVLNDFLHHPT